MTTTLRDPATHRHYGGDSALVRTLAVATGKPIPAMSQALYGPDGYWTKVERDLGIACQTGHTAWAAARVWWTCRPRAPEPPPRPVRVVQRVARYARTVPVRGEWCFVPGDVIPWREDYAPADRVVLDALTHVTENWGRGKW